MNAPGTGRDPDAVSLQRSLSLWSLLLYGLAVIVGAGIYVATATVTDRAGEGAPLSFLLAGLVAALTGLCYAELASRFPEASGAAAYVREAFGSNRFALVTALALTLAVAIAAASIASGAVQYLSRLIGLPAPVLTALLVVTFTLVATLGVRLSAGLSAAIGAVEILVVIAATWAGFAAAPDLDMSGMWPSEAAGWRGVAAGAFIAFFAFIGFESLVNMAEEARNPQRTIPYAILGAVAVSTLLYVALAAAVVLAHQVGESPLLDLFEKRGATAFAALASVAIANGVLVEIMMLARLFYGMANRRQLPAVLGRVSARTRAPVVATILAGSIVLAASLLMPFERLLGVANALTLGIFVVVDIALWRIQAVRAPVAGTFAVPRWVPPAAAAMAIALILAELAS
jgi:amino acid transporter